MADIHELAGSTQGGYRFLQCLGHGTHTAVYGAVDESGTEWAVKLLDPALESNDSLLRRLQQEAAQLVEMDDPTILPIHEAGRMGSATFAVTPLLHGPTLAQLMSHGPIDTETAWGVLSSIAEALERASRRGLVCRALKPSNVLLAADGLPRLTEFGLAGSLVGPMALATPTYRLSHPQYLAPEQVEGRVADERTDVYAVAVLIFELLTGTLLFEAPSATEVLRAVKLTPPPSAHARNQALPPAIDQVLSRALAKDPGTRPRSAWELLDQLVNLPDAGGVPAPAAQDQADTAATLLRRMDVPVLEFHNSPLLNSYFACLMRHAKRIAGPGWADVLAAAGLQGYLNAEPPDDGNREVRVEPLSRLADAFETVFGVDGRVHLRELGQLATEEWMESTQRRPFRMMGRASRKVADVLLVFTSSLDRVRGEPLHAWKLIDDRQFWIIHYANLFAAGRRRPEKACQFWIGAYQAALRWGGLAGDWIVDEVECGCVTGTFDCVFTVRRG